MRLTTTLAFIASTLAAAGAVSGETITVTTVADVVDINWQIATIEDLPGPDGLVSLSEAMIATNNTPGHQTIGFAIPADQLGWCCPQYDGIAVFHSITGFYWRAVDEVTIDGTTQSEFAGDTNPDGGEVLLYGHSIGLNAPNCTLVGFHSTSVGVSGADCLVEGNTGGTNIDLFQAHGTIVRGNTGGTIKVDRSNDVVVVGNTVQRVRVQGFGAGQPAMNTRVGGPNPEDRNFLTGYGTHNSEGLPAGSAVQLTWTQGTLIENNWIGTTTDGLAQGNTACTMGIAFQTENHDVTVRDNLIAGILGQGQGPHHAGQLFGWAIYFWGSTTNILIEGNTIGLDANGDATLGSVWGVNVDNFSFYTVDGVSLVDNVIAGHLFNGVRVGPTATMRLAGNSIHDNGWLGIDLIPDSFESGVSPNDPLDDDTGGNGVQNFPVIDAATRECSEMRLVGTLHSSPLDEFTVEFFASAACDDSGHGEGQLFLGAADVTTDGDGDGSFDVLLDAAAPDGWLVTATATLEPLGATSEFSVCVEIIGGSLPADLNGDGAVGPPDLAQLLDAWGPNPGSPADFNGDGEVGPADLSALLDAWGACE